MNTQQGRTVQVPAALIEELRDTVGTADGPAVAVQPALRAARAVAAALLPRPTTTTELPRIEDMTAGTTFWASFRGTDRHALFVKAGGKTTWPIIDIAASALATYTIRAIDEGTITLVTFPETRD